MPTPGLHVQTNKSHTTAFRHRGCVSYVAVVSGIILTAGLHSAFAADRGLGLQPGLPTESNDVAEPEAAVSSEAPFQKLVQLLEESRCDEDVVGNVPLSLERNANRHHVMSSRPACLFTARASTNNRSDSRLR